MTDPSFFARPAPQVAPLLLGATISVGGVSIRLTEVEAYSGSDDPGSHAYRGRTARTAVMFGEPGRLYCYFTYGMHTCMNIVCSPEGTASAVLLRAGEVTAGVDTARSRRTTSHTDADLARGPARLTIALGVHLDDNGTELGGALALDLPAVPVAYESGPRTGVSGEGGSLAYPWRFWIPGEATVSPYKRHVSKRLSARGTPT